MAKEVEMNQQNVGQEEKNEGQKLTYEQLVAYVNQISEQAKKIWEENQTLKKALTEATLSNNFREIELVLKCLDHADMFSPEFIDSIVRRLEEVFTPKKEEEPEADKEN